MGYRLIIQVVVVIIPCFVAVLIAFLIFTPLLAFVSACVVVLASVAIVSYSVVLAIVITIVVAFLVFARQDDFFHGRRHG